MAANTFEPAGVVLDWIIKSPRIVIVVDLSEQFLKLCAAAKGICLD